MPDYQIRWKRGDYVKLGKAVVNFNRRIKEVQTLENSLYLPMPEEYSTLKDNIATRKEFNRVIKMLKSFSQEGAEEIIENDFGDKITKWEYREAKKGINRGIKELTQELNNFQKTKTEKPYKTQEERKVEAQLKNLKNFNKKSGYDFRRIIRRGFKFAETDREMKIAIQYRKNYEKALDEISGFKNYEKLKNVLDNIKNPVEFFNFIQKSDVMSDLFLWYDDEGSSLNYGAFVNNEDAFDFALENDFNIKIN